MKLGIFPNMPLADYHKSEGLSSSDLKKLVRSPLHYRASKDEQMEQSAQMRLGTIVHCMILTPDRVSDEIHVGAFNTRRGKEFEKSMDECKGKLLCNGEEFDKATAIVEAFRTQATDNPFFNGEKFKLLDGVKEHSFFCIDPDTGLRVKARPDNLHPEGVIVDIKTTDDASPDGFAKSIAQFDYHISAAHYLKVVNQCKIDAQSKGEGAGNLIAPQTFAFVAIETKPPYAVATYFLSADAIQLGDAECRMALLNYQAAKSTNKWTGYPQNIVEINLPGWKYQKSNMNRGSK